MLKHKPTSQSFFSTPFLLGILAVSIITNIILITRLHYPGLWSDIQAIFNPGPEVLPSDHIRGNPESGIVLIEYSDFQCPFSADFHTAMKTLIEEVDMLWVYRHFPIEQIHPFAAQAAEASECAGEQGMFWEYADAVFVNQEILSEKLFSDIAWNLPLDLELFNACRESGKYRNVVSGHLQGTFGKKVSGTPTFYLNGQRFEGALPYVELKRLILERGGHDLPTPGICQ